MMWVREGMWVKGIKLLMLLLIWLLWWLSMSCLSGVVVAM